MRELPGRLDGAQQRASIRGRRRRAPEAGERATGGQDLAPARQGADDGRHAAATGIREGGVGQRSELETGLGVEVERGIVQVVHAELDEHEIRPVARADLGEESGFVVGVVAVHAQVQHLDGSSSGSARESLFE